MKKQIIVGVILIVIGVLLGWLAVVSWQLRSSISQTAVANQQAADELTKIEQYLAPSADKQNKP